MCRHAGRDQCAPGAQPRIVDLQASDGTALKASYFAAATRGPADDDEYPPTVEAMELLYLSSSNSGKRFIHYAARSEAPWLWYEPFDVGKVPATGGHGTDSFGSHPELPGIIVDWFVTTLLKTPGHAPADTLAAAAFHNEVDQPGGIARLRQQVIDARARDSQVQLVPEISMAIKRARSATRGGREVRHRNLRAEFARVPGLTRLARRSRRRLPSG